MAEQHTTIRGTVRSLEGSQAIVEVEQGGCGRCHEEGGCGGQQLTQMFCSGPKTYRVDNPLQAKPGEQVTIAVAAGSIRKTANLAYGVPLTAAILGAIAGTTLAGDFGAMLGACVGLVVAFLFVRQRSFAHTGNPEDRPHIVSRP